MSWFGWFYLVMSLLSLSVYVVRAGEPRDPWPAGWELLFTITFAVTWVLAVFFVGGLR